MKKILLAVVLGFAFLSSCSSYTCPTYAKNIKPASKEQIQRENV